jgi:hypothetical protein
LDSEFDEPPELRADELPELPEDELRPRDEADGERLLEALPLLDALPLLGLLREAAALLFEPELRLLLFEPVLRLLAVEAAWLFGLDPFELFEVACRLLVDRELAWAIAPP